MKTSSPIFYQFILDELFNEQREGIWKFIIKDDQITGTLMPEGNILYRKIEVSKK